MTAETYKASLLQDLDEIVAAAARGAEVPLTPKEQARLRGWFDYPVVDAFGPAVSGRGHE